LGRVVKLSNVFNMVKIVVVIVGFLVLVKIAAFLAEFLGTFIY